MRVRLRQISRDEAEQIDAVPQKAFEITFGKELVETHGKPSPTKRSRQLMDSMRALDERYGKTGLMERLRGRSREQTAIEDLDAHERYMEEYQAIATEGMLDKTSLQRMGDPDKELDLESSGMALHFLLTGKQAIYDGDAPYSLVIFGGKNGITRNKKLLHLPGLCQLSVDDVAEISKALAALSVDDLMARYDAAVLRDRRMLVAPEHRANEDRYLASMYEKLRCWYARSAECGNGMLIYFKYG